MNIIVRVLAIVLVLWLGPRTIHAVEGAMIVVTANPGKIMAGEKVLAEVPLGTRLWQFRSQGAWAEVKVPQAETHGWISTASIRGLELTAPQNAQLQQAHALYAQYQKLAREQKLAAAADSVEKSLQLLRAVHEPNHPDLAEALHGLGMTLADQGEYPRARKAYEEALAIKRLMLGNEHPSTALTLNNLGNAAHDQGDYPAARKFAEEALAVRRKVLGNDHPLTADTLNNLGVMARAQEDYAKAEEYYTEALALTRKRLGNQHPNVVNALNNLGVLSRDRGDYLAARKYYDEALQLCRAALGNQHPNTAEILNNLGLLASDQDDYSAARKYYEEALAIKRAAYGRAHPSSAQTLYNLGNLARKQSNLLTARQLFEETLALYRQALGNEHPSTAETLRSLGLLAAEQGDLQTARRHLEEAMAIYRKVFGREHSSSAQMFNSLGILASLEGNYPVAQQQFEEALAIYRQAGFAEHPDAAEIQNNLGLLLGHQGHSVLARQHYETALAIKLKALGEEHTSTAETLNNLGLLARRERDHETARKHYERALAIKRKVLGNGHESIARILDNLGTLALDKKDFPAAWKSYDEARRIMREHVQRALSGLSDWEQVQFLDNVYRADWTRHLSFGWAQRGEPQALGTAAAWLVNGKAVSQESLAARALLLRDLNKPELAPQVRELTQVRQRLAGLSYSQPRSHEQAERNKQLALLHAAEQRLRHSLAQATGDAPLTASWVELATLRKALPAETVYVDLVRTGIYDFSTEKTSPPHYLAWLITADEETPLDVVDLGEAEPIDAAIEKSRASLAAAQKQDGLLRKDGEAAAAKQLNAELQTVADLVVKPWQQHLADKKQLILSPDGALWLLPWAALPIADDKCLLEQCSIRYVTSGRDLVRGKSTNKLGTSAPAIVVNPDYDLAGAAAKAAIRAVLPEFKIDETATRGETSRSSLPRVTALPFTSLEGAAAKPSLEQLTKSAPVFFEQEKALEAVVKKFQRPKHLLLSTHGFFLPDQEVKRDDKPDLLANNTRAVALTTDGQPVENPLLRCGLLFAGCNAPREAGLDDGILTGMEIVGMDLRGTELVVLSACETGIGKVRNGEGVAGLRQAFQLAGAQSVVSTLWQVPDRDSAIIMQDFFTNLAAGQSKADALRNAQLKRIAARKEKSGAAHPFFWAAWTVTGE